jgi:hypothetical protein
MRTWHLARNTGVLAKFTPGLDIDIMDVAAAEAVEALAREHFEERGSIRIRIGLPPKRLIPLRTDEPFSKLVRVFTAPNALGRGFRLRAPGWHAGRDQRRRAAPCSGRYGLGPTQRAGTGGMKPVGRGVERFSTLGGSDVAWPNDEADAHRLFDRASHEYPTDLLLRLRYGSVVLRREPANGLGSVLE